MRWSPSERVRRLLGELGAQLADKPRRSTTTYLQLGKWLIRRDALALFVGRRGVSAAQLAGAKLARLDVAEGSPASEAQLLLPWDKEHCKLSLFDLRRRQKHVLWLDEAQMRAEQQAIAHFERAGLSTPPRLLVDGAARSMTQQLVGEVFANEAPVGAIARALRRAHCASADATLSLAAYLEQSLAAAPPCELAPTDRDRAACAAARALVTRTRDRRLAHQRQLARARCHGDPTPQNVLLGDDGELMFNDFDRSFVASVDYDFVCLHLTTPRYDRGALRVDLLGVDEQLGVGDQQGRISDEERVELALATFAADGLRYLAERAAGAASPSAWRFMTLQLERAVQSAHGASDVTLSRRLYRALWLTPRRPPLSWWRRARPR